MAIYWAIVSAQFRILLQYRAAAIAGFATQLFWGLIRVMIFQAFYRSSAAGQPMSVDDVITYVWLGQAFLGIMPWNVMSDFRALVRTGAVSYELLRPLDLYSLWYCRALAFRTAPTLLRSVPLLIIAGMFLGLQTPDSWAAFGAFALAMAGAILLSAAITTLLNISLMWTVSGEGITRLAPTAVLIFSGMIVPLPFFPEWSQPILNALPFRGLADTPFRLYSGHIPPGELLPHLAHQIAWIAAFIFLGRWVLSRGLRRLVVQGG